MLAESMLNKDLQQTENKAFKVAQAVMFMLILALAVPQFMLGQEKRAMEYFQQGKYSAVLDHYTKDFKNGYGQTCQISSRSRVGFH